MAVARWASRQAKATESRAGLVKEMNPVARVWMPGVCLRPGLSAARWVRRIHPARDHGPGCGAVMGTSLAGNAGSGESRGLRSPGGPGRAIFHEYTFRVFSRL
jgi:hypothetical protein